ncbi:porin [Herminiimonas glaciei]|uniref:Porin n=1 Tax=Herminiimonas glaciei TaxID=523788 RepID=A0ABW2IDD9_9BURK
MQAKLLSIVISAAVGSLLLAGNASAQSNVTIYGIADAGLEVINNASTAGNSNVSRISSGNLSGSRIGFRGTEELGGGLKAVFVLESGVAYDTGAYLQSNRAFGRQAYVGLQGSWGSLLLGRQNSLMLEWMSKYNTMDNATWSSKVHDASFSDRMDNSVKYIGKFGAFDVSTYYSTGFDTVKAGAAVPAAGEVAGHSKVGRQMGGGVQYNGGDLRMAVVYDKKNGSSIAAENDTDTHLTFGARYKFGDAEVLGGYLQRKQEVVGKADARTNMSWIGMTYQLSEALQLSGSYYKTDVKDSDKDPSSIITMVKYSLSKRTDLYLINSYAMNKNGSNLGVNGFGTDIVAGKNQFGTMAGIRHTF